MPVFKLKRRNSGSALVPGAAPLATGPGGLASGEAVWDNIVNILYIGGGDDGAGNATSIRAAGGTGAFVPWNAVGGAGGIAALDQSGRLGLAQLPPALAASPFAYPLIMN